MKKKVTIIGSGFSALAAASYLAQEGYIVEVFEKNDYIGGRARQLKKNDWLFDMGPTFYWMPDIFEKFFADFGKKPQDYYQLERLDPAYQVVFEDGDKIKIGGQTEDILKTFESVEKGSAGRLESFLKKAKDNYDLALSELVYRPGENILEIINFDTAMKLPLFFQSIKSNVAKVVSSEKLRKILEFPVLFLGATSGDTPAFYNFMNYADFGLGTWHPVGGMYKVVRAMQDLAESLGVKFYTNSEVTKINVVNGRVKSIQVNEEKIPVDILLNGGDYAHGEKLLEPEHRQYSDTYWEKRKFAPSALLFYIAFDKIVPNVEHHSLFFDGDFAQHEKEIYKDAKWPKHPMFYASFPSKTDQNFAPDGQDVATVLIPLAPGLEDSDEIRESYFEKIIRRLEKHVGEELKSHILFKDSFAPSNFVKDYHSYKANAYGLANTLLQTHVLRPRIASKKLKNMYFTGQLSLPGPGVPPSLISGKIASSLIKKYHPLDN